jgi:hypothetical protein
MPAIKSGMVLNVGSIIHYMDVSCAFIEFDALINTRNFAGEEFH